MAGAFVLVACRGAEASNGETVGAAAEQAGEQAASQPRPGVALSPRSYASDDFLEALDLAASTGELLTHVGDRRRLEEPSNGFEAVVELGRERGLTPLVVVSASSAGRLLRPLDEAEADQFVEPLSGFAAGHQPEYLGIGNEANMLATDDPDGFARWTAVWPRALETVRSVSPDTVVFPVLQYEWLLGRHDGMFGRQVTHALWEILDRFPDADAVGLTTFPGLVHASPDDVGRDYCGRIAEHTGLPIIITETGWPSDPRLPVNVGGDRPHDLGARVSHPRRHGRPRPDQTHQGLP